MEYKKGPELPRFQFPTPEYYDYGVLYDIIIQYKNFLKTNSDSLSSKEQTELFDQALKVITSRYASQITDKLDISLKMFKERMREHWKAENKKTSRPQYPHQILSLPKEDLSEEEIKRDAEKKQEEMNAELGMLNREDY